VRLKTAAAALVVPALLAACGGKRALTPPGAPPALRVAKNEVASVEAFATGTQAYACDASGRWRAGAPEAELTDREGRTIGTVAAGPTWEARDGGKVTGALKAAEPGRTPADLDWALFAASSAPRRGSFGGTSSIQRMDTVGGSAPRASCNPGDETRVPYKATYYFYRRAK